MSNQFSKGIKELRDKLIDTSRRNKLINYKRRSKLKNLIIIDESAEFIYNYLVKDEKTFKFKYIPEPPITKKDLKKIDDEINEYKEKLQYLIKQEDKESIEKLQSTLDSLENKKIELQKQALLTAEERAKELGYNISKELPDIDLNSSEVEEKYTDDSLQTLHYPNEMEKILTSIERDARTIIEETGSNMLYLVLGLLKWNESNNSEIFNNSPLINIPIVLTKKRRGNRYEFTLEYSGAGIDTNRALAEKLNNDYGIILPELTEEKTYYEYLKEVSEVIKHKKEWTLKHEIAIDFLKFGKILMYQDLKEENWENGTPLSDKKILKDIFEGKDISGSSMFAEEYDIDYDELANKIPLVMNADSSQHSAILDVLSGKNVVIEGPPGTGKSQTISNLIATLLASGKTVLFVSEKLAALEVVYKRLEFIGLSDFCLELHSHKSKKTKILESIKKRIESTYYNTEYLDKIIIEIEKKKKELKEYIDLLHKPYGAINKKVYNIFWLVEKYNNSSKYLKFDVPNANEYNDYKFSHTIDELKTYQTFLKEYNFNTFYWKGLDTYNLNFIDIDDFIQTIKPLKNNFAKLQTQFDLINLDFENEYIESKRITTFIKSFEKQDINYSKEILTNLSKEANLYDKYLEKYLEIKDVVNKLALNLNNFNENIELFENLVENIMKIDKVLKHIRNEANLSKNSDIEYIKQLSYGIKSLLDIDLSLYTLINKNYLDIAFSEELNFMKQELAKLKIMQKKLSKIANTEKVDELTNDEIDSYEKIILDKKNSFFNIFSREYKEAKNTVDSILVESLPKDKTQWEEIISEIKNYISFKTKFESNKKYIDYFGKLFNGINTNVEDIEKLHNWVLSIKQKINISEIIKLITSGEISIYELLISYKDTFCDDLESFHNMLNNLESKSTKRFIKKLYYDREDINIQELKEKIFAINDDLEHLVEVINKSINKNQNENIKDKFLGLIKNDNLENFFISIKRYDIGINDFVYNFENFVNLSQEIKVIISGLNIELNDESHELIVKSKNIYKFIVSSKLNNKLKQYLVKDIERIDNLKVISNIQQNIDDIYEKIQSNSIIKDEFFGHDNIKIRDCIKKLDNLDDNKQTLSIWINFRQIVHNLEKQGLKSIVVNVENGILPIDEIINNYKYNFYHTLLKEIFRTNQLFNTFNRLSHEQSLKTFKELDIKLIELNKQKVAYLASQRDVPWGYRGNRVKDLTESSLLEHEIHKKKRHIPIRQLVSRASKALQALKPCFMMSPLSVSQYLPPNQIEFDVLIIDEASQLKPEEALGSIARVNQIVIVGDPKQLPPTSFFDTMNKKDDDETVASESESILDICLNLYRPIRQLRWHYRSQHESLIDFSNKQFYDGNLIIFPSPISKNSEELGVKYHYIENSVYQNGRNKVEAKFIVEYLEKQMKNYPNKSVGIGTFNSTQRELIQDMIDEREKHSPIISNYIAKWSKTSEPFFVKNLENLQGDERDVIIISTTFGKDKDTGRVYQRFGPINSDTGWRRLNVMFTRSKQKMEIFTSLKSSDIIISENSSRGVRALKAFLNYLEKGVVSEAPKISNKDFDSEFEVSVYNILKDCGFEAIPQVGVAGYFIDLAVRSKTNPNDFVLAIECDGATYHSSKSARDRDRLKQDVLETLGWNVYRIWSVDWYKNRENEISKLIKAVKEAQYKYNQKIQSSSVKPIEVIKINNDKKEFIKKQDEQQKQENILSANKNTQAFFNDEDLKKKLIKFRDEEISKEFKIDRRCILSDLMIDLFIKYKPIDIDEFRTKIPLRYRNERIINIEQLKYLNDIFDILELADE